MFEELAKQESKEREAPRTEDKPVPVGDILAEEGSSKTEAVEDEPMDKRVETQTEDAPEPPKKFEPPKKQDLFDIFGEFDDSVSKEPESKPEDEAGKTPAPKQKLLTRDDLTEDQKSAMEYIESFLASECRQMVLCGPAGTGKTSLVNVLLDELDKKSVKYVCTAPTNKAVEVIAKRTNRQFDRTIYSLCGLKLVDLDDREPYLERDGESKLSEYDVVVIDEAYFEYSLTTNTNLLDEYDNIFILRTMSKVMGLAGMRIGYGISSKEIIEFMHRIKPVFSLTKLSYVAALTTIKDIEYIEKSIKDGIESRDFLYDEISKMKSVKVYKSYSNFMLIDIHDTGFTAAEITREFMKRGMIVRDCTSFKGLDEYYFRISICTLEEDKKFLKVMKEILNEE